MIYKYSGSRRVTCEEDSKIFVSFVWGFVDILLSIVSTIICYRVCNVIVSATFERDRAFRRMLAIILRKF